MAVVNFAEQNRDLILTVRQWAIVAHFADRVDLSGLGIDASGARGSDGIDAVLIRNADEFISSFPVDVAHAAPIDRMPEVAGEDDDLGLRLGVEGDAGEWEFAGLLMNVPRE